MFPLNPVAILIIALGIAVGGFVGGCKVTADRLNLKLANERLTWTEAIVQGQKAKAEALAANDKQNQEAINERTKNQASVNDLFAGLSGISVQLPVNPVSCAGSGYSSESGVAETIARDRLFREQSEQALARFKAGVDVLAREADLAVEDCRAVIR